MAGAHLQLWSLDPLPDSLCRRYRYALKPWRRQHCYHVGYDPEVLVIAPCGFTISRTGEEIHLLTEKKEWAQLTAVRNNAVFMADYDLFTQPGASTLTDGIELLAALFHPTLFTVPAHLQHKYQPLTQTTLAHV